MTDSHSFRRGLTLACLLAFTISWTGCQPSSVPDTEAQPREEPVTATIERTAPIHVLCLASEDLKSQGLTYIDETALQAYEADGFKLHLDYYQDVTRDKLFQYPVVIGMTPMLHAGTRAIDEELGKALVEYMQQGGGFLLIPGPSYYGIEDFTRQLNPWLAGLGAELVNDQPRDPENQRAITRIIQYQYLSTTNLADHYITRGIDRAWLPLGFTDAYLRTHTMRVTPDWQILIRGENSCATYELGAMRRHKRVPGAYAEAPPFLAVRRIGKGHMGLFTTASRYFIFDAYHWAHADGFVMEEGHGRELMGNLIDYLAGGEPDLAAATGHGTGMLPPPPVIIDDHVEGNVPLMQDRTKWMQYVFDHWLPEDSGVKYYVDCGSLSDRPFTNERGWGYLDTDSWLIRWSWSEYFHPTAANARGFDIHPLSYRFDDLDPEAQYRIGLLTWAYQEEGAKPFTVTANETALAQRVKPPRYALGEGPAFTRIDVPRAAYTNGTLTLSFHMQDRAESTFASVGELWLFETGNTNTTPDSLYTHFLSPSEGFGIQLQNTYTPFSGLIGARSTFSGGPHTVETLSDAAREAGLDFLVFTEDAKALNEETLEAFRNACAEASDKSFRAIPGIAFSASYTNETRYRADLPFSWGEIRGYLFQHLDRLPSAQDYANPYRLFWRFFGGELCGGIGSPPTITTPTANDIPPFHQRFWRGLDVISRPCADGKEQRALSLYADLLAHGYGPRPRASECYMTPEAVRAAKGGWKNTIYAPDLERLEAYAYDASIGNGPQIDVHAYSFDHARHGQSGEGVLFREAPWMLVHAEISSPRPVEEVTLYSGLQPLRKWYPNQKKVTIAEPFRAGRNHELWLHVKAVDGSEAVSGRFLVQNREFMIGMCGDNQNTICNLPRKPTGFAWDDREMFMGHSYWHTGQAVGQLGAMRDARELVPRIIETGIIQPVKYFIPCPKFYFADGTTEDHTFAELRMLEANRFFNRLEYRFDTPESRMRSRTTLITPRPNEGGDTVVLVECEIEAKEDVRFAADRNAVEHLRLGLLPQLARGWSFGYGTTNGIQSGAFKYEEEDPDWRVENTLAADSGVLVWSNSIGSLLALPLDGKQYRLDLFVKDEGHRRETFHLETAPVALSAGDTVRSRFLVALHQGAVTNVSDLPILRKQYAGQDTRLKAIRHASIVEDGYMPLLNTTRGFASIEADTTGLCNPMPLRLKGIQPAWSCGVEIDGRLQVLEAATDTLVFSLPPGRDTIHAAVGNILLADSPGLVAEWAGSHVGGSRLHLFNRAGRTQQAHVRTNPGFSTVAAADIQWPLHAGKDAWLWARERLAVAESAACQVLSSEMLSGHRIAVTLRCSAAVRYSGAGGQLIVDGNPYEADSADGLFVVDLPSGTHRIVFHPEPGRKTGENDG